MNANWLPGLPDHPCVCDVRIDGEEHLSVAVSDPGHADCQCRHVRYHLWPNSTRTGVRTVFPGQCQWRPITAPEGA